MTQQQVFSLYLANLRQNVKYDGLVCSLLGVSGDVCEIDIPNRHILAEKYISDCKLLLKDIADMSEEHKKHLGVMKEIYNGEFGWHVYQWLITHGYCLDMEWVKAGWVEIVRGE